VRRRVWSSLSLSLLLGVAACHLSPASAAPDTRPPEPGPWASATLRTLTLRDKAAQMVWPTVLGDYVPESSPEWQKVRAWVADEKVGGITISVGSPTEIAAKLNAMQRLAPVPLLVGADVEFGAGYRARGGYFTPNAIDLGGAVVFPPQMAVGATGDTALAALQGRVTAAEGRALGIHVAYAPILDVNNNPANPVINTRSYGEDPELAARLGTAFVRGLQEHGMIATGKHFPGHGDTETNSHLALPTVGVSRARLDSVELVPFRAAIGAGLGAIMSFHGAMPALDSTGAPGTLSAPVLTGLLRGELGFRGLVISDAMDMRGVLDRYGAVEAAKRAVAAGADVLIQPLDVRETIDAVVAGVHEGRYTEARLDSSVLRILAAKARVGLGRSRYVPLDSVRLVVGAPAHVAAARTVAERSIAVVKDSLGALPLGRRNGGARVLSVTVARRADLGAGAAFNAELRRHFGALRAEFVSAEDPGTNFQRLQLAADSADVTIVSSYMAQSWDAASSSAPRAFVDFVRQLAGRGARPVVVAFGNPYLLRQVPEAPAYVVAWGGFPVSQRAAARALLGEIAAVGRPPIELRGTRYEVRGRDEGPPWQASRPAYLVPRTSSRVPRPAYLVPRTSSLAS
jgi:beta-N-acetylhexosaminidase